MSGAPVWTLKDLLLSDEVRSDLKVPPRDRHPRRATLRFD